MHSTITDVLATWHDGQTVIIWRRTPSGMAFLNTMLSLPREVRQDLLRTVAAGTRDSLANGVDPNTGSTGMLALPLANVSPFMAEFPAEAVVGWGSDFEATDTFPAENAVLIEAAIAAEAGRI